MKYSGKIGFWVDDIEVRPGVWKNGIVEKPYTGDVIRSTQHWQSGDGVNDNLKVNNSISVIADLYLKNNLSSIKYVTFMGTPWKVTSIEIKYPRVTLEMGDVWNGVNAEQET